MISNLALPALSRMLNQYLKLDPEMQSKLVDYEGKVIRFHLQTLDWIFYISIVKKHIHLRDKYDGPIDASIKLTLLDCIKNLFDDRATMSETMELQGDTRLLQAITTIFKNVEIDWEELLARFSGDSVAHEVANVAKRLRDWQTDLTKNQKLNLKEYLQEELELLAPPLAIEDFCKSVDEIRDQVERMQARLKLIREHLETT